MSSFYGDNIKRMFFGMAITNSEVGDLVQVRIHGIHGEDVKNSDLPWAQIMLPSTEPRVNGTGTNPMIAPGAQVFGVFLDGEDSQVPLILGTIPKTEVPSNRQIIGATVNMTQPAPRPAGLYTGAPSAADLSGSTNAETIFNFFVANGFTQEQAAGWVGNFSVEVGPNLDPDTLNPNDKGKPSFGLAQWRGDRYQNLIDWASEQDADYKSMEAQLGFTLYELTSSERRAANKISETTSAIEAARTIDKYFERSDGTHRERRVEYAKEALKRFAR